MSASDPDEYVVHKALMYCTAGTVHNWFAVSQRPVRNGQHSYGNVNDKVSGLNINSFAQCTLKGGRCVPLPTEWRNYDTSTKMSGGHALMVKSEMPCATGGIMKFATSGQIPLTAEEEYEVNQSLGRVLTEEQRERFEKIEPEDMGYPFFSPLMGALRGTKEGDTKKTGQNLLGLAMDGASLGKATPVRAVGRAAWRLLKPAAKKSLMTPQQLRTSLKTRFERTNPGGKGLVRACFTGETLVHCESGLKRIDTIEVGERVWSFDEEQQCMALSQVTEAFEAQASQLIEVHAGNTIVFATLEHPFMCDGRWQAAANISQNNSLQAKNGNIPVTLTRPVNELEGVIAVFNLEVEETHTYYVGIDGLLVHNPKGACGGKTIEELENDIAQYKTLRSKYELEKRKAIEDENGAAKKIAELMEARIEKSLEEVEQALTEAKNAARSAAHQARIDKYRRM